MHACISNVGSENINLDQMELDHECDLRNVLDKESDSLDKPLRVMYRCAACGKEFDTICKLHNHLQYHVAGGSYYYDHVCRIAVPKFDTCCAYTQTELIKEEPRNSTEINDITESETNNLRTKNTSSVIKKTRGRPKGSKNVFSKKRKLINAFNIVQTEDSSQTEKGKVAEIQDLKQKKDDMHENDDYNDDTDVEFDFSELKSECNSEKSKPDCFSSKNGLKEETSDSAEILGAVQAKILDKTERELETDTNNVVDDTNTGQIDVKLEPCKGGEETIDYTPVEIKVPKNKRKMVQPRKVLKQDGKNKFKNKAIFKNHAKQKKKLSQPLKQVQLKQGFTKVEEDTSESIDQGICSKPKDELEQNRNDKTKAYKTKLFKCGVCNMTMSRYKMLRHNCEKNKEEHGTKKSKKINCEFCGFPFLRSEYDAHLRTHTGERPFICEKCGKDFARIKYLKKHLITHEKIKPFICNICGAGFCQNKEYKQHMCSHTGQREHICNVCDATFICKASLLTHVQNIHLGETRFECDVCLRRFFKRSSLNLHRATHFEASLSCRFCAKRFKDTTGLKRHEKIHTGVKNFKCHLCEHAFVQSTPFWSHMEKRHGLSKDEAKKVHKENVEKARVMKQVMKNQTAKSEPGTKPIPILQQPLLYNTSTANVKNIPEEYDTVTCNKDSSPINLNNQKELTRLTSVEYQASVSQENAIFVDNVNYHDTVDVSKYVSMPQPIHYHDKGDYSEFTHMHDISGSNSMHKSASDIDTQPTSDHFVNVNEPVQKYTNKQEDNNHVYDVEMLEKMSSELRDYSRYQYDIAKREEQYTSLYDPLNYEKVHDLSNPDLKVTKLDESRYEEGDVKERTIVPEEAYNVLVKVPDPSLYTWNKKEGHYEKMSEVTQSHNVNISDLDQYKQFDKTSDVHGLKISDLLPVDKPQDLSYLSIAYQNYLMAQSQYEKVSGDFDKMTGQVAYSSVPVRLTNEGEQGQVELARVQSPYEEAKDQSNMSM